jgi:hypothetical protein
MISMISIAEKARVDCREITTRKSTVSIPASLLD